MGTPATDVAFTYSARLIDFTVPRSLSESHLDITSMGAFLDLVYVLDYCHTNSTLQVGFPFLARVPLRGLLPGWPFAPSLGVSPNLSNISPISHMGRRSHVTAMHEVGGGCLANGWCSKTDRMHPVLLNITCETSYRSLGLR